MGDGDSVPGGEAASALRNSRNSAPVRVGKKGVEWAFVSAWMCSPWLKRIPKPCGLASGLVSGIWGESGGIGEAESDGSGRAVEVGCGGEFFGYGEGCEGAIEHQATSVGCVLCLFVWT